MNGRRFESRCLFVAAAFCATYGPLSTQPELVHALLSATFWQSALVFLVPMASAVTAASLSVAGKRRDEELARRINQAPAHPNQ